MFSCWICVCVYCMPFNWSKNIPRSEKKWSEMMWSDKMMACDVSRVVMFLCERVLKEELVFFILSRNCFLIRLQIAEALLCPSGGWRLWQGRQHRRSSQMIKMPIRKIAKAGSDQKWSAPARLSMGRGRGSRSNVCNVRCWTDYLLWPPERNICFALVTIGHEEGWLVTNNCWVLGPILYLVS